MDTLLHTAASATSQTAQDREPRIQDLLQQLCPEAEQRLCLMAERLVDLPEHQSFGQIEYDLRDWAHQLAADVHQTGLQARKKGLPRRQQRLSPLSSRRSFRRTPPQNLADRQR
jgi:hypothetical protein